MPQNARRDAGDHDPRATAPAASIRRSSLKAGIVAPSVMLRKLAAYRRQNQLDLALQELGRIERTLFMLDWLESPELRRRCHAGLNKSEQRHFLVQHDLLVGCERGRTMLTLAMEGVVCMAQFQVAPIHARDRQCTFPIHDPGSKLSHELPVPSRNPHPLEH
jgi:hypothetical protein